MVLKDSIEVVSMFGFGIQMVHFTMAFALHTKAQGIIIFRAETTLIPTTGGHLRQLIGLSTWQETSSRIFRQACLLA
jgi:hypothetical protein